MNRFEVYKDKAGEFRFRYVASNSEVLFSSEGYRAKASVMHAIQTIRATVVEAKIDDRTPGT